MKYIKLSRKKNMDGDKNKRRSLEQQESEEAKTVSHASLM